MNCRKIKAFDFRFIHSFQNSNDKVKKFYEENKHSALGDAETLCRLSNSKALHDRFRSWVICFNSLIGPAKERIK